MNNNEFLEVVQQSFIKFLNDKNFRFKGKIKSMNNFTFRLLLLKSLNLSWTDWIALAVQFD